MARAHCDGDEPRSSRAIDVVWFNYPMYVLAIAAIVVAGVALAVLRLPTPVRLGLGVGAFLAAWWSAASTVVTVWVFELSGATRWRWLADCFEQTPERWLNITSGFDDTTHVLRHQHGAMRGGSVDVFDPAAAHDGPLLRARGKWPPTGPASMPGSPLPVEEASQEAVFLLMAAHELRDREERRSLLREVARVLTSRGRLVVAEHLRTATNAVAFGPGVTHFYDRATWLGDAEAAGLRLVRERGLTPFAAALVFERGTS